VIHIQIIDFLNVIILEHEDHDENGVDFLFGWPIWEFRRLLR